MAEDFNRFVDLYFGRVYYHALKLFGNPWDADDVTQETFLKAFMKYGSLKNSQSFGPWLFTICNNEITNLYRKRHHEQPIQTDMMVERPIHAEKETSWDASLYKAIDLLSQEHREVIIFKYFAGLQIKQIALLTGISEKRVKSRLYEARIRLKSMLENPLPFTSTPNIRYRRLQLMERMKFLESGAYVVSRMSLAAQMELLECAKQNRQLSETVLKEMGQIDQGKEFVALCSGKVSFHEFSRILACCDTATVLRIAGNTEITWGVKDHNSEIVKAISEYSNMGCFTHDMTMLLYVPSVEDTVAWYEKVLGWSSGEQDVLDHEGRLGFCHVFMDDIQSLSVQNKFFRGLAFRRSGNAKTYYDASAFISIVNIEGLRQRITSTGWQQVSDIVLQGWGAKTMILMDLNGFTLEFYEWA